METALIGRIIYLFLASLGIYFREKNRMNALCGGMLVTRKSDCEIGFFFIPRRRTQLKAVLKSTDEEVGMHDFTQPRGSIYDCTQGTAMHD
jgi:hypothetical protein